jgi:hypothetical protein
LWLLLVSIVAALLATPPANADPDDFGATYYIACGYYNGTSDEHTSCASLQNNVWFAGRPATFGNQWSGIDTAVQQSLSGDYNPTHLVAYWTTTDNYPDVWFWDYTYWAYEDRFAWTDCPASNTGVGYYTPLPGGWATRWCRGQIIRFNWAAVVTWAGMGLIDISGSGQGRPLDEFSAYAACHEMGHTLGLQHNTYPGCINYEYAGLELEGYDDGYNPNLTDHERGHINARY